MNDGNSGASGSCQTMPMALPS